MASLMDLFGTLVALPEDERAAFLDQACAGNETLRAQLLGLLAADRKLEHMTLKPAAVGVAEWAAALGGTMLVPGQQLGAFRLLAPIGQGGMGVVFRAERADGTVAQQVAIKVVRREFLDDTMRQRFALERQALATLDHPYIARLIDAAETPDGLPYFVMEYVDGAPIDRWCAEHQPDLRARVQLVRRVCQAVAHAHRHLLVHRDLKPGNILVGADGLPKLLDFGIAKRVGPDTVDLARTGTAHRFFSPGYAAPEQLRGGAVQVGCDIYALGVLLYELLAGRPPFDFAGLSFGEIERRVLEVPVPPPSTRVDPAQPGARGLARTLRGDLDGIVQQCLRKDPSDRYASVAQLDEDLGRWLDGMPVSARHGHRWYRLGRFIARHRLVVAIGSLSVLALLAAAAALWQQNLALRAERDVSGQALSMMQDAFIAADPIRAAGADVNARRILESARRRLEPVAERQPALFATLAKTIAQVDLSLGQSEEAADLLARAESAAAAAGQGPDARIDLLVLAARALVNADRLDEAQQRLDAAKALSADPGPRWRAMQGRLWTVRGRTEEGIAWLRAAITELAVAGPEDDFATSARYALAEAIGFSGDHAGELASLDETLSWQRASLPAEHPQVLRTRLRRLVSLRLGGQAKASVDEARAVLGDTIRIFGADTAEAAYVHNALARSLEALGLTEDALDAYRKALDATIQSQGFDHANTGRVMFNLAWSLQSTGRHDAEADTMFRSVVDATARRLGPQAEMTTYYRLYYGRFLEDRGRSEDALLLLAPEGGETGLANSSPENRDAYLKTLTVLAASPSCTAPRAVVAEACARAGTWTRTPRTPPMAP